MLDNLIAAAIVSVIFSLLIYLIPGFYVKKRKTTPFVSGFKEFQKLKKYHSELLKTATLFLIVESMILLLLFFKNTIYASIVLTSFLITALVIVYA